MAILSLFLDRLKVDKLSKSLFLFFLYTENVNAVGDITYKDNEHLAVKCIVLHSLGMGGVLFAKMVKDMVWVFGTDYTSFVVTMVTGVYLVTGSGWRDVRYTCFHHQRGWRTLMIQYTHDVCEY